MKYISVIYGLSVVATRLVSEAPRRIRVHRVCALKLSLAVSKLGESALILSRRWVYQRLVQVSDSFGTALAMHNFASRLLLDDTGYEYNSEMHAAYVYPPSVAGAVRHRFLLLDKGEYALQ